VETKTTPVPLPGNRKAPEASVVTTVSWFETATPATPRSPASRVPLRFVSSKTTPRSRRQASARHLTRQWARRSARRSANVGGSLSQVCVEEVDHGIRVLLHSGGYVTKLPFCRVIPHRRTAKAHFGFATVRPTAPTMISA